MCMIHVHAYNSATHYRQCLVLFLLHSLLIYSLTDHIVLSRSNCYTSCTLQFITEIEYIPTTYTFLRCTYLPKCMQKKTLYNNLPPSDQAEIVRGMWADCAVAMKMPLSAATRSDKTAAFNAVRPVYTTYTLQFPYYTTKVFCTNVNVEMS